jgi:hypothetical protein
MAVDQQIKELRDFTDLTSDKAIREAAYPEVEWLENGGGKGNGFLGGYLNSYSIVATQDNPPEISPRAAGILSGGITEPVKQNLEKRAANIASHWEKVQSHVYYKKLNNDVNYTSAWNKFQIKIQSTSASKGYKSEFANFRFYNLIALHIGYQMICDEVGYRPEYPKKKVLEQAEGHIGKLQADFKKGLKLNDSLAQLHLESHLKQLALETGQAPRKDKETETAPKRRCLEGFALACIYAFDEASSTILGDLAVVLGWQNCHPSTIGEIVSFAKEKVQKERNKALAKALKIHA